MKMSAMFELELVSAEVSYQTDQRDTHHTVFKRLDGGFEAVKSVKGNADVYNFFTEDSEFRDDEEKRNYFWKLRRNCSCQTFTKELLDICNQLDKRGVMLVHKGIRVTNFFAVNGPIDISDLEEVVLKAEDPESSKMFECSLYSTVPNKKKLTLFPPSVCALLDISSLNKYDNHMEGVAGICKIDVNACVPHWWACFVLENHTAVHVDLCGPAYDLFYYSKSLAGLEAPVYMIITPELSISKFPPQHEKEFPHKLYLLLRDTLRGCVLKLPSEYRPFVAADKLSMEITPTDALLARCDVSFFKDKESTVNKILHKCIQFSLQSCQSISVKISNIVQQPKLNGQVLKVHSVFEERIAVEQKNGTKIKLIPAKLEIVRNEGENQVLTLREMRERCEKATENIPENMINGGDIVVLQNLVKSLSLNNEVGTVVDCISVSQSNNMEDRFIVQLNSIQVSIARKNLKVIKKSKVNESKMERIRNFLQEDPDGIKFYQRVIVTLNDGLTNITEPDLLPALEKLVSLEYGLVVGNGTVAQRRYEVALELSKMPSFSEFREFVQYIRSGYTLEWYNRIIESKPEFTSMLEKCYQCGILNPRK